MKKLALGILCLLAASLIFPQAVRNISSLEAYEKLKQPNTFLLDVRTVAEYVYVGHPHEAYNIPTFFWVEERRTLVSNPNFLEDVMSRFKAEDTLIIICRSGGRSARAVAVLQNAGFKNAFNVENGFEGQKDDKGLRTINGWKISGSPYTYEVDKKYAYVFK